MKKKNLNIKKKYVAGSATVMAVAVAACSAGVAARDNNSYNAKAAEYGMGKALCEETTEEVTDDDKDKIEVPEVSTDEIVEKLTSNVNVDEKDIYKDETVYAFADPTGKTNDIIVNEVLKNKDGAATLTDKTDLTEIENVKGDETFTQDGDTITWEANGNDITYQGKSTKELPVNVKVIYYLDGKEIKPEELAGKSGKVKMRFEYTNNQTVTKDVNGKKEDINVPFVAVTGMALNSNFTNISVTNGKTIQQGDSNLVVGFGMPGLMDSIKATNEDFAEKVDVPDFFEVEADVTDFSLDMTATVVVDGSAMNIAGEVDMSSLDDMMKDLSSATDLLVDGSGQLSDGISTLLEKMGEFNTGMGTLKAGIDTLSTKSTDLITGIGTIDASAQSISNGITQLDSSLVLSDTAKTASYNQAYNQAYGTVNTDANKAASVQQAQDAATAMMAPGTDTYNGIKAQASAEFSGMLTGADAQNAAVTKVQEAMSKDPNTATQIQQLTAAFTQAGMMQAATQVQAAMSAQGTDISLGDAIDKINDGAVPGVSVADIQAAASAKASATINGTVASVTTGVMNSIAADYSDAMGDSVATACQQAAVQAAGLTAGQAVTTTADAAGQAAGQAAVAGAQAALGQVKSSIEAVQSNGYSLVTGAQALAAGTSQMNSAVPTLSEGISALQSGALKLTDGSSQIVDGVSQLNDGAITLKDGLQTYDTEAISKIINSYNGDVKSLVERLSAVASAASDYDTYTMTEDGKDATTKFIIKTAGISAE